MKILFITPYFSPDYAASSPMYAALAEDLSRMGHQVTVITGMPYYGKGKVWEEYKGKIFLREETSGYKVIRVYTYAASRDNIPGRILSWGLFNLLSSLVGLVVGRYDALFIPNPFFLAGVPMHVIGKVRRTPVVYSVEDIYPDVAVRLGLLNAKWAISLVAMMENSCYQRACYIRVLSEGMRMKLVSKGIPAEKVITIPYFADVDFVRPLPRKNKFRQKYALGDEFVVLYAGNMGFSHGLDTVIKAADILRAQRDIVFVLVGEGAAKKTLQQMARNLNLQNVRFVPFQPREDVPFVLASADVSLISLKKDFVSESVPSKTYWILASGRPVVACVAEDTEVATLIEQADCGFRVEPEAPHDLANAILQLYKDPSGRAKMGRRAREFVVAHYSREVIAQEFHALFQRLLQ